MSEWKNWSGSVRAQPKRCPRPKSEAEIAAALLAGPAPVRALGAGHSFSPLSETNGTLISLADFSGLVAVSAADSTASARAGTRIHALGRALFDAGVALKNQGDIDRQSLAGAVGTGTHGTGPTLGSLKDIFGV